MIKQITVYACLLTLMPLNASQHASSQLTQPTQDKVDRSPGKKAQTASILLLSVQRTLPDISPRKATQLDRAIRETHQIMRQANPKRQVVDEVGAVSRKNLSDRKVKGMVHVAKRLSLEVVLAMGQPLSPAISALDPEAFGAAVTSTSSDEASLDTNTTETTSPTESPRVLADMTNFGFRIITPEDRWKKLATEFAKPVETRSSPTDKENAPFKRKLSSSTPAAKRKKIDRSAVPADQLTLPFKPIDRRT